MLSIARHALSSAAALAVLAGVTSAQAEVVTYYFTATIDSADAYELDSIGFPNSGDLSGSLTYDTSKGWWGGSNVWADPSMDLTIDQMPPTTDTSTYLTMEYNAGELDIHNDSYDSSYSQVGARVELTGQSAAPGSLPSTLAFGGGAGGVLTLFVGGNFSDIDLTATLTSLSQTVAASTPELDPAAGGAALVLLLGGAFLLMGGDRRRRFVGAFG